jgi:hypothetical protein
LTPLPGGIHCAATNAPYVNILEAIDIDNFLDTLAAVASRNLASPYPEGAE